MIIEMMNDVTLSENDKDWVKMFEFRIDDILKNDYCNNNNVNYRFDFNEICKSIGLDSTILNKEGTLMYALWVTLLNGVRKYKLLTSFKYPTIELFLNNYDYYDKFKHENEIEIKKLWYIANWMSYLFTMVSAKKNKGLAMIVIPKLIEGWNIKYITGSGQTRATTNRVHIFECEGNVKANHRGKVKKLKMLEDDNTNEAASLLLSQIKNHEKHLKPKKRRITKTKTNNTINSNSNNHHYNNFDHAYNHQLIFDQQQQHDDHQLHKQQLHKNVDNNNDDEINNHFNSMQYFQTNEFDLLAYNSSHNLTTLLENNNDSNGGILNNDIHIKNINNNISNNINVINNISNEQKNIKNEKNNININHHDQLSNSGTKRSFDITLDNENNNFNEWKEQTENFGFGLLALSRNSSYTADLQREFSWLDSSALDLMNSVGGNNIIDNNIRVNNDNDHMNLNSRGGKNGDIDVNLIDASRNYIPVDDLIDAEDDPDNDHHIDMDDTDIADDDMLISQSSFIQPFTAEKMKKQYSPFENNNHNFSTTTTTMYTDLNHHQNNVQKKTSKKKEFKQGCLFPIDELPRLPSHPFRMSSECWADIPIIPGEPIVPIKDVDSWRKSVKMPISTPVVAATAAVVVNPSIAGLKLKKQQQLQQQQKMMYSTAPNNNINKVRYTGAGMNCSQPFQANSNTTASIMHGNYNTASYNYNNNNNNNNQQQKQQLANSYLNTIVNASSAALDVPLVADASLPVVERMPSDIETFPGGMNYTTSAVVCNSNNINSNSSSTTSSTTVPSILPQKQVRGKVRSSLQSSLPLDPSHLSITSTNNTTKYSSCISDGLESTAGVLHCEALLSLFHGYN
jgi:hypothetical protein